MRSPSSFNPWRLVPFYLGILVVIVSLVMRLLQLQVVEFKTYNDQATENRLSRISDPAPRGIIYDRRGVPLVINVPAFNIVITPAGLPDEETEAARLQKIYERLSVLLNMPIVVPDSEPQAPCRPGRGIKDLVDEFKNFTPFAEVKIKCDVDKETALLVRQEAADLPGVGVVVEPLRQYTTGPLTSNIIGYMAPIPAREDAPLTYDYFVGRGFLPGRDRVGVSGIEASMQDLLAGVNGSSLVEKDVGGQTLRVVRVETATVPGFNIQLTIDSRLQAAAQAAVTQRINYVNSYLNKTEAFAGVAIVTNPNTGEILAMVSWPTYDNNRFARNIDYDYYTELAGDPARGIKGDPMYPLLNHAVNILYPPGSVFKVVTAVGALEEGVVTVDKTLDDPGKITVRDAYYPDDNRLRRDFVCWIGRSNNYTEGHGPVDYERAIEQSCNVYFYKVGGGFTADRVDGLGIENLGKWMRLFGFGRPTGVELPGELGGFIPSRDWKRITWGESWSTGDTYNAVIGQGYVHATPLQMLNAYNVIINGGWLYQPTLIDKILDGEGNVITDTQPVLLNPERLPISQNTLDHTRAGMRRAVTQGTLAGGLNIFGETAPIINLPADIHIAGKTGTAEFCDAFAYPRGWCIVGNFPTHSWTALYGPYENPEVSVIVFVYHGGEGSKMAAPIAANILRAYFELKQIDSGIETEGN